MKLVRFEKRGTALYGVWEGRVIRELSIGPFCPEWDAAHPVFNGEVYPAEEVILLAPCEPTKYLGVGMNYRDLAASLEKEIPKAMITFNKPLCSVIGPGEKIVVSRQACQDTSGEGMIFEGELCAVIGKRGKHIPPEHAIDYVLGYTCTNDVTYGSQFGIDMIHCKGADTFGPIGPCISTDVDPFHAHIRSWVNGEKRQDGCSDQMIFDVPSIIAYFSSYMTLMPGDIIATGTPAGKRNFQAGDVIRIEIDGIGVLENPAVADL